MRRHIIGILALLLLAYGLWQFLWGDSSTSASAFITNSGFRIGMVLAALWLAFPEVKRLGKFIESMPTWFFYTSIAALFAAGMIRHPVALLLLVPILFFMWLLKPPPGARPIVKQQESVSSETTSRSSS